MQISNKNSKNIHYVWWYDQQTGEKDLAGVAYYNEWTGNYNLTLNFFPNNKYEIQSVGYKDDISHYRIVSYLLNPQGKKIHQYKQGTGFLDQVSGDILIKTAPFNKFILITPKENHEKKSA